MEYKPIKYYLVYYIQTPTSSVVTRNKPLVSNIENKPKEIIFLIKQTRQVDMPFKATHTGSMMHQRSQVCQTEHTLNSGNRRKQTLKLIHAEYLALY